MRVPAFLGLAAATTAAVVIAAVLVAGDQRPPEVAGAGEKVFPRLFADAGRIAAIGVRQRDAALTIAQADGAWVVRDRNNYPASIERVRQAVVGLGQLEKVAPKTDRPDRYGRIGVEDAGPDADSTEVTLSDAAGQPVARLLIGRSATGGGISDGVFIRLPGESRSWLARGQLMITPTLRDWVDTEVADIPASKVREVQVRRPDGTTLTAVKETPQEPHFALRELPAGRQLKSPEAVDGVAGVLAQLDLEDVKPADQLQFDPKQTLRARFVTFDGLVVEADFLEQNDTAWVVLRPSTGADAGPEVMAAATALADRSRGWAFEISSWKLTPLRRPLAELVAPKGDS
jgi:hypothetical protein